MSKHEERWLARSETPARMFGQDPKANKEEDKKERKKEREHVYIIFPILFFWYHSEEPMGL